EVLRAESNEFHHLKNNDGPTDASPLSSTIDDNEEDDRFSNASTHDDKPPSTTTTKNEN
ncbi:unnamed protein product, partial [Rotaria socialis]